MSLIQPQYPDIGIISESDARYSTVDEEPIDSAGDYPLAPGIVQRLNSVSTVDDHTTMADVDDSKDDYLAFKADESDDEVIDIKNRRQYRRLSRSTPEGFSYAVLKYPLLFVIGLILVFELICYVIVRQYVNLHEYLFTWHGKRRELRLKMRAAQTYDEWVEAAYSMDLHLKLDHWKTTPESAFYDYRLIKRMNRLLSQFRQACVQPMASGDQPQSDVLAQQKAQKSALNRLRRILLDGGVKSNLGGIENVALYSKCYLGTKNIVDDYVEEVCQSLQTIHESTLMTRAEKAKFFKKADRSYGKSALCLSGGACLGYYHLGVLKALFDDGVIPRVMTGTSAGSLIASFICTRTDEELQEELNPELYKIFTACDQSWPAMLWRCFQTGAAFDPEVWIPKLKKVTHDDLTFLEAYERTGRILNISVIPTEEHSPPKLLNYKTTPDIVIWSAVLCSSAVPFILPPMELRRKLSDGRVVLYHEEGSHWRDGSIRIDVPVVALHQLFHVNHTVVSQVNPHIAIFFFDHKGSGGKPTAHRGGRGWRGGFVASYLEHTIKLDLVKWVRTVRDLSLLPSTSSTNMLQSLTSIFLQKFDGTITILPKATMSDYLYILTDPSYERMCRYFIKGQQNTWPKLSMIRNRMKIELAIARYRELNGKDKE